MYYIEGSEVYIRDDKGFRSVTITAKDKVTVTRELASITVIPGERVVEALADLTPHTLENIARKFHLTEANPIGCEVVLEPPTEGDAQKRGPGRPKKQ